MFLPLPRARRIRTYRRFCGAGALAAGALLASASLADEKESCARAAEAAQDLRGRQKLADARRALVQCAADPCPAIVRNDCTKWLAEVDEAMPSIAVVARDAAGNDLTDVRVFVDGVAVATELRGSALAVDPGEHAVRFESPGRRSVEKRVIAAPGEKFRPIRVVLEAEAKPEPEPEAAAGAPPSRPGPPALAYVAAGASALGFASFFYFALTGVSDINHLRSTCAPHCAQSDVDSGRTKILVGDIGLGVGVLAAGVATWLFLSRPSEPAAMSIGWFAAPGGGGASLQGGF